MFLESNNFTVFFRTSETNRFKGFQMHIACLGEESACDMRGIEPFCMLEERMCPHCYLAERLSVAISVFPNKQVVYRS